MSLQVQGKSLREWVAEQKAKNEEESARRSAELHRLAEACGGSFPDLQRHVNRWRTERFYSKQANSQVTEYDLSHNCGCCNDSPLELWPFMKHGDMKVYSDPPCFTIGERNGYGSGEVPYEGWQEKLRAAGIPEPLIARVQAYMDANPPRSEDDDDNE